MSASTPSDQQGAVTAHGVHSVSFNGELVVLPEGGLTLTQLLQQQGLAPESVATAVNAQFVPRHARGLTQLQPGDAVVVIQPIVGG